MPIKPFRQITPALTPPALTDQVVGVQGGRTDVLWTFNQISEVIGGGGGGGGGRTILKADTNYYVATSGSDANPGTQAAPWLTVQHAMNVVAATIDTAGFNVIVNIGVGTFAGAGLKSYLGGGTLEFKGAGVGSTIISNGPNDGIYNQGEAFSAYIPTFCSYYFNSMTVAPSTSLGFGLMLINAGFTNFLIGIDSFNTTSGAMNFTVPSGQGADVFELFGPCAGLIDTNAGQQPSFSIAGSPNLGGLADLNQASDIFLYGHYTITGSPALTGSFFSAFDGSYVGAFGTFSGTATGPSIVLAHDSGAFVNHTLPGSTFGSVDYSSSYNGQPGTNLTYPQGTTILRTVLTANTSFYVSATGSDSNNGSITAPWLTLQHAMDFVASKIDIGGFAITINIGAGSFAGVGIRSTVGGGNVNFVGAGSTSTTLTNGNNDGQTNFGESIAVFAPVTSQINFDRVKLAPNKSGVVSLNDAIDIFAFVRMNLYVASNDVAVDCTGLAGSDIMFWIDAPGVFVQDNGLTITGGSASVGSLLDIENGADYLAGNNGSPWHVNGTLTVNPFLAVDSGALFQAPTFVGGGAVVGQRFLVILDGHVTGFGLTPTSIPGTIAGVCDSSSTYGAQPGTALTYPQPTTILRTVLTANTSFYVNNSTGSDSNNGSVSAPWLTLQHAWNTLSALFDLATFTVTINLAASATAYVLNATSGIIGGAEVDIVGAGSGSTKVSSLIFGNSATVLGPLITFAGMTIGATSPSQNAVMVNGIGTVFGLTDVVFAAVASSRSHLASFLIGAELIMIDGYTIAGGGGFHINADLGYFEADGANTISGTQAFTASFAQANDKSEILLAGSYSGTATGQRFNAIRGSTIFTNGGSLTDFPGSTPGFCDSGSSYNGQPGTDLTYPQPTTILRTVLTANTSFYVSATGSDSNNGSSSSPWLTPQHAMNFISEFLDLAGFTVTVNVGAGTFAGVQVSDCVGGGFIQWEGAGRLSTTLTKNSGSACFSIGVSTTTVHAVDNLTVNDQGVSTNSLFQLGTNAAVLLIGNTAGNHVDIGIVGNLSVSDIAFNISNGTVFAGNTSAGGSGMFLSGSFLWVIGCDVQGQLQNGAPWHLANNTTFGVFAEVTDQAMYSEYTNSFTVGTGVTGKRFELFNGGSINNGANSAGLLGPNAFPGNAPGTCDTSSSYDGFQGPLPGINTYVTGHTFTIADAFQRSVYNGTGAAVFTIPGSGTVNYEIGTWMKITQINTGNLSIAAGSGVTLHNAGSLGGQWRSGVIYKDGTDDWVQTNV